MTRSSGGFNQLVNQLKGFTFKLSWSGFIKQSELKGFTLSWSGFMHRTRNHCKIIWSHYDNFVVITKGIYFPFNENPTPNRAKFEDIEFSRR